MTLNRGIILALFSVLFMAFTDVFSRFAVIKLDVAPAVFASLSLLSAAFIMIVMSGPGKGGMDTIRSPFTWGYSILNVLFAICEVYTYSMATTFEGYVLYRSGVVVSLVMAFFLFQRKPSYHDLIAALMVMAGVLYVGWTLPDDVRALTVITVVVGTVLWVSRTFMAEFHDASKNALSVKEEMRVTGFVLLITSMLVMVFYAIVGFIGDEIGLGEVAKGLPSLTDFKNTTGVTASIFAGLFIVSVAKYTYFIAARDVQTENYMTIATLGILLALLLELAASQMGIMPYDKVEINDIFAGFLVMAGALYMIVMRYRAHRRALPINPEPAE